MRWCTKDWAFFSTITTVAHPLCPHHWICQCQPPPLPLPASCIWSHSSYLGLTPTICVSLLLLSLYQADLPMLPTTIALPYYPISHDVMYIQLQSTSMKYYVPTSGHV